MSRFKQSPTTIVTPTEAILESISDGVFTVDLNWRITSFNRAAETITGIPREEAIGRHCSEVFRSNMCETDCALCHTLGNGRPVIDKSGYIIDAEGRRIPISVSTAVLRNDSGEVIGAAETFRDLSEVEELRKELEGRFQVGDLVSRSTAMRDIFDVLPSIAASESTLLIQGETGTGKELLARAVHDLGPRRQKPFVAVNCGALPDTLLESELFGYRSGAFTGANRDKPGRFALAAGGTLFLDEIGEVTPALQVRLLRVLQERVYEPLGAIEPVPADVRIIAATNRDLADRVRTGEFRQDLYYRIHVIRIDLPPLRRRKEDIPLLTEHFIARFNRMQGKSITGLRSEVMGMLMAHDWPGNVRELENVIERAFVLCERGPIGTAHLPDELKPRQTSSADSGVDMTEARKLVEAQLIREALERNRFNRVAAARDLGIHKSTLFRKIRSLDITIPEKRKRQD